MTFRNAVLFLTQFGVHINKHHEESTERRFDEAVVALVKELERRDGLISLIRNYLSNAVSSRNYHKSQGDEYMADYYSGMINAYQSILNLLESPKPPKYWGSEF